MRDALLVALACAGLLAGGCAPLAEDEPTDPADIRRSVVDLRPPDLERFPVWERLLAGGRRPGEVRPRPDLTEADPRDGLLLLRIELVAADATRYDGYAYASLEDDPGSVQPTLVTDRGQVGLWHGASPPERGDLDDAYDHLDTTADALFPLRYRALVPHGGVPIEGELGGFLHTDGRGGPVVEVT